jgi:hypothetical protein
MNVEQEHSMNHLDGCVFEFQKCSCPSDLNAEDAPNLLRKVIVPGHFNIGKSP